MTDPLSVTASVVALVGAFATASNFVLATIKSMRNAPDEIVWLSNEISNVRVVLEEIQTKIPELKAAFDGPEQSYITEYARSYYQKLVNQLGVVQRHHAELRDFMNAFDGTGTATLDRIHFTRKKGQATRLQKKMKKSIKVFYALLNIDIASSVHCIESTVCQTATSSTLHHRQCLGLIANCENYQQKNAANLDLILERIRGMGLSPVQGTSSSAVHTSRAGVLDSPEGHPTEVPQNNPREQYSPPSESTPMQAAVSIRENGTKPIEHQGSTVVISFQRDFYDKCKDDCGCICHLRRRSWWRSPIILQNLVGFFSLSYYGALGLSKLKPACSLKECKSFSTRSFIVTYCLPRWFLARAAHIAARTSPYGEPQLLLFLQRRTEEFVENSIYHLSQRGNMVGLAEVLQKHMASPNDATVSLGATALHFAVIGGKTDAANYLIQRGAKVHLQDDNGLTPIQAAWELILEGRFSQDTTTGLKDAFPECSSFPTFDFSDLHKAVVGLLPVRPELMLLRPTWRTQVDFVDAWGRTPLHWAVKKGDVLTTESLIRACSNVNIQDKEGMTALHVAAGRPAILKTLIEAGANTCLRNKGGAQAIHWASMASAESIRLLLEADDCVETKDDRGGTPLGWSICSTNIDCCKYLIKRGANINYVDENNGDSSIFTAVSSQAYDCLKMLLACDIDILHINNSGSTILHWIARNGDNCTLDIVDGKVSKFGSLNTSHKDRAGKTAREVAQTRVGCPAGFVEHFLKMVDDIENMQANGAVFTNSGIPNQTDEGSGIHQTRVSRNKGLVGSCLVAGIALFAAALFLILEWARSRFF